MLDLKGLFSRYEVSPDELCKLAGIDRHRMDELLAGAEPTLADLRKITTALNVPLSTLVGASKIGVSAAMMFRRSAPRKMKVDQASVEKMSHTIGSSFDLLRSDEGPSWAGHFAISEESYETAEQCADQFRQIFCGGDYVSPIHRLPSIVVKDMEILLFLVDERHIEGASAVIDGQHFIFVSRRFPPRMLFTLGHELGHLIAHKTDEGGFAMLDLESEDMGFVRQRAHAEQFADAFASVLLLPSVGVGIALKKIREIARVRSDQVSDVEILYLSRIFGTSFQAAARRCEDLALLPHGGAASLYETLKRKHSSPEKRAEELGLPPRLEISFPLIPPKLLASAIEKIKAGDVSIGRAAAVLGISISDLITLNAPAAH